MGYIFWGFLFFFWEPLPTGYHHRAPRGKNGQQVLERLEVAGPPLPSGGSFERGVSAGANKKRSWCFLVWIKYPVVKMNIVQYMHIHIIYMHDFLKQYIYILYIIGYPAWKLTWKLKNGAWKTILLLLGQLQVLTWKLNVTPLERKIIFQTSILGFHVSFGECTHGKDEDCSI